MAYISDDKMTGLQKAAVTKLRKDLEEIEQDMLKNDPKAMLGMAYAYTNANDYLGAFERNLDRFDDEQLQAVAAYDGNLLYCKDIRDSEADDEEMLYVWDEAIDYYCDVA